MSDRERIKTLEREQRELREIVRRLERGVRPPRERLIRLAKQTNGTGLAVQELLMQTGNITNRQETSIVSATKIVSPYVLAFEQDGQWFYCQCGASEGMACPTCTAPVESVTFSADDVATIASRPANDTDVVTNGFWTAGQIAELRTILDGSFTFPVTEEMGTEACISSVTIGLSSLFQLPNATANPNPELRLDLRIEPGQMSFTGFSIKLSILPLVTGSVRWNAFLHESMMLTEPGAGPGQMTDRNCALTIPLVVIDFDPDFTYLNWFDFGTPANDVKFDINPTP